MPVLLGVGNIIYLSLSFEPNFFFCSFLLLLWILLITIKLFIKKQSLLFSVIIYSLLVIIAGVLNTKFHTELKRGEKLYKEVRYTQITGTIEKLNFLPKGCKITLTNPLITKRPKLKFTRIKITAKNCNPKQLNISDTISFYGYLGPVPASHFPGLYDYRITAYFEQIAATGYTLSKIETIAKNADKSLIDKLRSFITIQFIDNLSHKSASIATALIIGETSLITKEVTEQIRISGLAHMLAVSGMHVSLVTLICFITIRFVGIILLPNYAQIYDFKKIAAGMSIIASFIYLLLSGAHVAAVRAFIMSLIIMIGIIFIRQVTPMRTLSFAAIIILVLNPHVIYQPSFQMSFSAVLGLISLCKFYVKYLQPKFTTLNFIKKFILYSIGIISSSIIATLYTLPFTLYHFGNFAPLGVIANLLAIPVLSFLVMPLLILWLFLLPLNLHSLINLPLDLGINLIATIAAQVSALNFDNLTIRLNSPYLLSMITLGLIWFSFWNGQKRWLGIILIILSIGGSKLITPPAIIIDTVQHNLIILNQESNESLVSNLHLNRIYKEQLKKVTLTNHIALLPSYFQNELIQCDSMGCIVNCKGQQNIPVIFDPILTLQLNNKVNLFILLTSYDYKNNINNKELKNCNIMLVLPTHNRPWH
ncbi:ComEC/Rec2 family competence protein [Rickettsiales endosymbiont of Stachyamoeba lipophora]|uniref:ComEC/Rec2 family competence protein n=1 Tax=Rickettsiales endosymbiont of Stachyamoeba lipophora TaxID=2486578 RepID=UPI000F64A239|nr:ComEC/Rec2 family competence protein [Rickettsiales endosymbiont of Stachyamoeba lipophora]